MNSMNSTTSNDEPCTDCGGSLDSRVGLCSRNAEATALLVELVLL